MCSATLLLYYWNNEIYGSAASCKLIIQENMFNARFSKFDLMTNLQQFDKGIVM